MKNKSVLTILGLSFYCLIVFLPPIIHGYVYPNIGDDSGVFLKTVDWIKSGDSPSIRYFGEAIVGYPLAWFSDLTTLSVDSLYLWFSYVVLALVGIALYFVISWVVNKQAGWFALILTLFCAQGILFQFYFGQICNIINIGIILPVLLFFTVKYLRHKKFYLLVLVVVFAGLFGSFHTSGIYLPSIAGFVMVGHVAYSLVKKERLDIGGLALGIGIVVLSAIAFWVTVQNKEELANALLTTLTMAPGFPVANYMMDIMSPTILLLLSLSIVYSNDISEKMHNETKMLVSILFCAVVLLAVSAFAKLSLDPWRQALDLATLFALLLAVFMGLLIERRTSKVVIVLVVIIIGFGLFHSLSTWFGYNSAIRTADKQAIAYVNSLNRGSYNCSPQVAPWIYSRYLTLAKYEEYPNADGFASSILIVRDLPMTPRSDPTNMWYESHGIDIGKYTPIYGSDTFDDDYNLLKSFSDDKVTVRVYENVGNASYLPVEGRL